MSGQVYTVSQVNRYVKSIFTQDYLLRSIDVEGEVSNCKYHSSGHLYFSLKDAGGTLQGVMFAGSRSGLSFRMKDGDHVVVSGSIDVYERDGKYQLYARRISLAGTGILYEKFLRLKSELEEMGMFDPSYKSPIPRYIRRLGVVTAPTGAAVQDIRNVSLRRNPWLEIILYPAQVQGEGAADSIVKGIECLDRLGVDTIIVGRGGGSLEDLWAFNEEKVARAIFACHTPVISAVGHETDFTIADFAADLRAPTPSAAAELAVDDMAAVMAHMDSLRDKIGRAMNSRMLWERNRLSAMRMKLLLVSPESLLRSRQQRLADLQDLFRTQMQGRIDAGRRRLLLLAGRLEGLSPVKRLAAGYSYVRTMEGEVVTSVSQAPEGSGIRIRLTDGELAAKVTKVLEDGMTINKA